MKKFDFCQKVANLIELLLFVFPTMTGCSMIFEGQPNPPSTAHGARSAAATVLRRSHCCDGAAQTSSVALILRVASRHYALNEEPASFSLVVVLILISMLVVAHTPQSWATL